jgi:hypothetical protein
MSTSTEHASYLPHQATALTMLTTRAGTRVIGILAAAICLLASTKQTSRKSANNTSTSTARAALSTTMARTSSEKRTCHSSQTAATSTLLLLAAHELVHSEVPNISSQASIAGVWLKRPITVSDRLTPVCIRDDI